MNSSPPSALLSAQADKRLWIRAERLRWLISLRWLAIVGIILASIVTQIPKYALFEYVNGWYLAPPTVLANLLFWFWLRWLHKVHLQPAQFKRHLLLLTYLQVFADSLTLTTLVYLNGGVECPIYAAPLLAVMVDAVLLSTLEIFVQANVTALLLAFYFFGVYFGFLPDLPYLSPHYSQGLSKDLPALLARLLSTACLLNVTAYLISGIIGRLNRLEERSHQLIEQMREQVLKASQDLADSSAGLSHGASDVNLVAGQMASTVQQIAQGAAHQAGQLENISHNLEGLADASRGVASSAQETHHASAETVSLGERGLLAVQEATARMDEIAQLFGQTEQALQELVLRSREIGEIASSIDRFAERTDLLALNAGIEAARAGEHGRGFAVVAGEVKKLATSSSNSAARVADMVEQIQSSLQAVVSAMRSGDARLSAGQQSLAMVQGVVGEMSSVTTRAEGLAKDMERLSQKQLDAHQSILQSVGEIASAAEQTAAGAEEAAAAVEEQASAMSDFSQAVAQLAELAEKLKCDVASLAVTSGEDASDAKRGRS